VVVAGVLVSLVATTAVASDHVRSNSIGLLVSVWSDASAARTALTELPRFDASGTNPDFAGSRRTADQYASQLAADRTTIQADDARLHADRDLLVRQASGMMALPFRPGLDQERMRVDGMRSALHAADTALQVEVDQVRTLSMIFDVEDGFDTLVVDHVQKQDVAGALALLPGLADKLRAAAQAVAGPSTAPQARKLVGDLQTLSTDLETLLQAARHLDLITVLTLQPKVQADGAVVEAFDSDGLESYERTLLQPYVDRFDSGVRAAGFVPRTIT